MEGRSCCLSLGSISRGCAGVFEDMSDSEPLLLFVVGAGFMVRVRWVSWMFTCASNDTCTQCTVCYSLRAHGVDGGVLCTDSGNRKGFRNSGSGHPHKQVGVASTQRH